MSARVGKFGFVVFTMLFGAMMGNMLLLQSGVGGLRPLAVASGDSLVQAAEPSKTAVARSANKVSGKDLVVLNAYDKVKTTRTIQRELTGLGYLPGAVDGTPGLMTRAAIMAFEFDNGLSLRGRADPDLLKLLLLGLPPGLSSGDKSAGTVVGSDARRVVATVQQTLQQLGYKVGKTDGEFGVETEQAIRDFESDQNLGETGRVSGRLVARLVRLADNGRLAVVSR